VQRSYSRVRLRNARANATSMTRHEHSIRSTVEFVRAHAQDCACINIFDTVLRERIRNARACAHAQLKPSSNFYVAYTPLVALSQPD